jgi:hypothetical protein
VAGGQSQGRAALAEGGFSEQFNYMRKLGRYVGRLPMAGTANALRGRRRNTLMLLHAYANICGGWFECCLKEEQGKTPAICGPQKILIYTK